MNAGAQRLAESGWSLAKIVAAVAKRGGPTVTRTSAARWRSGEKTPGAGARGALARSTLRIPVEAWDLAGEARGGAPAAHATPPPSAPAGVGLVSGEALARDYLHRVTTWRQAAEESGSVDARVKYAGLELRAVRVYLAVTGQATATELEIGRSPQWTRLRGELLAALEGHPDAAKAVLAVMDRLAPPAERTGT